MKKILLLTIIVLITISFTGCPDLFGDLENELDPDSDSYQGFETVDDVSKVVIESIEWDGNTLVFLCSFCVGVETYYLELSSSETDFAGNILTTATSSENLWEISENLITADTFYYRFRAGDGDWSNIESFSGINHDPPPEEVTDLEVSVDDGSVTLTWTNPTDSDFSHCELWYGTAGTADTEYDGATNNTGTTVTGLTNRTEYTFTVYTVDDSDNRSDGASITAVPDDLYLAAYGFVLKTIIPEGETVTFTMGDDTDVSTNNDEHEVILGRSFLMSETEITQSQYYAVTGANPSAGYGTGDDYPVYNTDWYDAVKFCNSLSVLEELTPVYYSDAAFTSIYSTGSSIYWKTDVNGYRLPTEAEWEYAARGGEEYPFAGSLLANQVAWYDDNSDGISHIVKGKNQNGYGLYDMSGNIAEWCWDWYGIGIENPAYYFYHYDPLGPESGSNRMWRGGSFFRSDDYLKTENRSSGNPSTEYYYAGFRVVRQTGSIDVTPPAEVTDLEAVAGSSMVTLTWTEPEDDDLDHYEVWYGIDENPDTQFSGDATPNGTAILYIENGSEYTFKILTVDNRGNTSPGSSISETPQIEEIQDLNVSTESTVATLSWTDPTIDGFHHCEIWYGLGTSSDTEYTGTINSSGTTISGLNTSNIYSFRVVAVDYRDKKGSGVSAVSAIFSEYKYWSSEITNRFGEAIDMTDDGSTVICGDYQGQAAYVLQWNESSWDETELTPSDDPSSLYGYSVAVSNDGQTVAVGAAYDDDTATQAGAVYIYRWSGSEWNETKIIPSDNAIYDAFGRSVSLTNDGDRMVVGADGGNKVYIYDWDGDAWSFSLLTASDGQSGDIFGTSVFITPDGTMILIGAPYADGLYTDRGAAYLYQWNGSGWDETIFTASDAADNRQLGGAVSISGNKNSLIIGENNTTYSYAYLFQWDGANWNETKFSPSILDYNSFYGNTVDIDNTGEKVIIGAPNQETDSTVGGSLFLYQWDGSDWMEFIFSAADTEEADYFGKSARISSDGELIIVGAPLEDPPSGGVGSLYKFY